MRIAKPATDSIVSLQGATRFDPVLDGLAARLGRGWYLEASRTYEGLSMLLVMAADTEADLTLTVSETPNGFVLEEMKADQLRRLDGCQTLDQVTSLVTRHVFKVPAHLCVVADRSAAA